MKSLDTVFSLFLNRALSSPQQVIVEHGEQVWTYSELLTSVERIMNHLHIELGEKVYQYVTRSLEMPCGLLAIVCAGGVYCPLNPADPPLRTRSFLDQIQGRCVLVHGRTREKFLLIRDDTIRMVDIEAILLNSEIKELVDEKKVYLHGESLSFMISSSGTTGRSKMILHTHQSLLAGLRALTNSGFRSGDKILQIASPSWVVHVLETLMPLLIMPQTTLVILRIGDELSMARFCATIEAKQITFVRVSPSVLQVLTEYLDMNHEQCREVFKCVRILWTGGETIRRKYLIKIKTYAPQIKIYMVYGMSEAMAAVGCYFEQNTDASDYTNTLPFGQPVSDYRCVLIDSENGGIIPSSNQGQIGEICLGGTGLFKSYYNNPTLTERTRIKIDNDLFFKTGDLAQYDARGELIYAGRLDFQIKIHGQRVNASEIESTVVAWSSNQILDCVVVKFESFDQESIIAYVLSDSSELNLTSLRAFCTDRLSIYMVPSYFIILDKFPLTVNGKVDRKQLPSPMLFIEKNEFANKDDEETMTELEVKIHYLWCSLLQMKHISRSSNLFALGGSSILLMQIFNHYQNFFNKPIQLDIFDFFANPTIEDHARRLTTADAATSIVWQPLHLVEGPASHAQTTVWLAERTRFVGWPQNVAAFNSILVFRIESGSCSFDRCLEAINVVIDTHTILRTRILFDHEQGYLKQVISICRRKYPVFLSYFRDDHERDVLIRNEAARAINIEFDGAFRCHVIRHRRRFDEDTLLPGDFIVFSFHHALMDGQSVDLFLEQFKLAYANIPLTQPNLQYIDYSVHERTMPMIEAKNYWREALRGYGWDKQPELGINPRYSRSGRRTDQGEIFSVVIPRNVAHSMMNCSRQLNVTLFQLGLSCFYLFLNQVSSQNRDACVGVFHLNRYRPELASVLGMFVNLVPCRIFIESLDTLSFADLVQKVKGLFLESARHAHLPYQEILDLHRVPNLKLQSPFIQVIFRIDALTDFENLNGITLDGPCKLSRHTIENDRDGFVHDLTVLLNYHKTSDTLECTWQYMTDPFDSPTIEKHANNFIQLLTNLFGSASDQKLYQDLSTILATNGNVTYKDNKTLSYEMKIEQQQEINYLDRIRTVYAQALGCSVDRVDEKRTFFELGGTSMKAVQAVILLQQNIARKITFELFFDYPTISQLARALTLSYGQSETSIM